MRLIRTISTDQYTMGYFELPLGLRIYSLERPWVPENRVCRATPGQKPLVAPCGVKGVSCVPPGIYKLESHMSEDHPGTLALFNPDLWVYHTEYEVPPHQKGFARTAVLIHPATWPEQLRGCIAPGLGQGDGYVNRSRDACRDLYRYLRSGDTLAIINAETPATRG